jgi:hypothetical protein
MLLTRGSRTETRNGVPEVRNAFQFLALDESGTSPVPYAPLSP